MASIESKEEKDGISSEVRWTDDMIRWDDVKPKDENDSDEEEPIFDPFKDPDPMKSFNYRFPLINTEESSRVKEEEDESNKDGCNFVDVELRGYKTDADEVWQSTGVTLWRAATFLCDYMVKHVDIFEKKRILELGAGLGLNGILAHRMTMQSFVCLTDGDSDALIHLRSNVEQNKIPERETDVTCHQLIWGEESSLTFLERNCDGQTFDVLLASDIIYVKCIIPPLWETVRTLLNRDHGVFVMAFAKRRVPVSIDYVLETAIEAGFDHELVEEDEEGIWVYLFRWKEDV